MTRTGFLNGRGVIAQRYHDLREASRAEYDHCYPSRLQRYFNNLTNFEYSETVVEWVGQRERILIIGDAGGRDYHALSALGKRVVVLDVAPQLDVEHLILGDICRETPFREKQFDAVVMAEVIEHLFDDVGALREIRRVLRPDGVLILTTPIGNDAPEYHVRVYTPRTLTRLLAYTGFKVDRLLFKGGGFARIDGTLMGAAFKHIIQYMLWRMTGRTRYRQWNATLRRLDLFFSEYLPILHRCSRHYGMFVLTSPVKPSDTESYTRCLNVDEFSYRI